MLPERQIISCGTSSMSETKIRFKAKSTMEEEGGEDEDEEEAESAGETREAEEPEVVEGSIGSIVRIFDSPSARIEIKICSVPFFRAEVDAGED